MKTNGKVAIDKMGNQVIVPAVPTQPQVREVRRGMRPIQARHRGISYLPGDPMTKQNIYYWPGFKRTKSSSPIPPILTSIDQFGNTLDREDEYYSKLREPPLSPRRDFEFPGSRDNQYGPPIEPGVRYRHAKVDRPVIEVLSEVPRGALDGYEEPYKSNVVYPDSIFLSDGTVTSEAEVLESVEAKKEAMAPEVAAKVNWATVAQNALRDFRDQYQVNLTARSDPVDRTVSPPSTGVDLKPILTAAALLGLGIFGLRALVGRVG